MSLTPLTALSPVDGRYAARCAELREIFSEQGLIRARVRVEIAWLQALAGDRHITELRGLTSADLAANWELLAEPIQTVMRRYAVPGAYEQLTTLTRGRRIDGPAIAEFVDGLPLPPAEKARLKALTPATYIGLAARLARDV